MIENIKSLFTALFNLLLSNLVGILLSLNEAKRSISTKFLLRDVVSIITSAGMVLVFQLLSFLIFVKLPQGQDIIMVAVDELRQDGNTSNLWGLVIGTVAWSIFSEFAVRYAIYVTDNSGNSLSEQRVVWRKAVQQAVADIFLLLPYIVMMLSLWANYKRLQTNDQKEYLNSFLGIGAVLYLCMIIVSQIYFAGRNAQKRKLALIEADTDESPHWVKNVLDRLTNWCYGIYTHYFPAKDERAWLEKLQGIYNDHVFELHKHTHFNGKMEEAAKEVERVFLSLPAPQCHYFPQSPINMSDAGIIPAAFRLRNFTTDGLDPAQFDGSGSVMAAGLPNGHFRWQYHIPLGFYKRTHLWLGGFVGLSLIWMVVMLFLNSEYYDSIGSAGLVLGAFCSWTGIYMGVLFLDFGVLRRGAPLRPGSPEHGKAKYARGWRRGAGLADWMRRSISLRTILLIWLLFASYFNTDHNVRYYDNAHLASIGLLKDHGKCGMTLSDSSYLPTPLRCDRRPEMTDHFRQWVARYIAAGNSFYVDSAETVDTLKKFLPVVFVCAEGGAMRTGAFTSLALGCLQDHLAQVRHEKLDFRKTIYACSGVSGGSVGLAAFTALAYIDSNSWKKDGLMATSRRFFENDYLSATLGKLFYGDLVQLWWPWHVRSFDRIIGLETSLEHGYAQVTKTNTFSRDFLKLFNAPQMHPALFINTTEVESGLQCWLPTVRPPATMFLAQERDLFQKKLMNTVPLSTAINFSTRFPIFAPAACVPQMINCNNQKYHYVDGGYVENSGAATMLEILHALRPVIDSFRGAHINIRPCVITLRFEEDESAVQNISMANEISEILFGIYNTRAGRLTTAQAAMKAYVEDSSLRGQLVKLQLKPDGHKVPMSWVFSAISIGHLDSFVDQLWSGRDTNDLKDFVFINKHRFGCDTAKF